MNIQIKQICPICETGEKSRLVDKHSEFCPHIFSLNTSTKADEKFYCPHFKKIDRIKQYENE